MSTETELKLGLSAAAATALRRHPLFAADATAMRLENIYYDTPGLDLLRAGIALRHRRCGRGWLLTVKSAEPAAGGLARRSEWEAVSRPDEFDFSHVDERALRRRLERLRPALQPVFSTDFRRRAWLLEPAPGVRIEAALDQGEIRCGEAAMPIRELELELLSGPPQALFDLALALQDGLPLFPEAASKAERGYRLFQGKAMLPARAGKSPLVAGMAPRAAFCAVAFACLDQLLRNAAGARAGSDAEFVHQARVAVRRLRSALHLWAPLLPAAFVARWKPVWRDFARQLGAVRDLDVLADETLPPLLAALPDESRLRALSAAVERRRARARRGLRPALAEAAFGRLTLTFAAALHALPEGDEAASDEAFERRLRRLSRSVERLAAALAASPETAAADAPHRLRIAGKRLRYALEFTAPLRPRKGLSSRSGRLAPLLETLGRLNDIDCALAFVAGNRRLAGADLLGAWLAGRRALLCDALPTTLRAFVEAGRRQR